MGYRMSWLAVRGLTKDQALDALHLSDTGKQDEANEAPFSAATLPDGWIIVWANDEEYANETRAAALSSTATSVVAVHVNETCMHSTASFFERGTRLWRIHHEGDELIDFIERDGNLPPEVNEIEAQARASQADEDAGPGDVDWLFDVPLETARTVCGYKHDHWRFEWGEPVFTVVLPRGGEVPAKRRDFIRRLLGRE